MTPLILEIIRIALYAVLVFLNTILCYNSIKKGNKDAAIAWLVALLWTIRSA